jgi:hypothetical protein
VSSGKSASNSGTLIPPARYSSTSRTVIRIPRMHGWLLRLPGSMVMRCVKSIWEVYPPDGRGGNKMKRAFVIITNIISIILHTKKIAKY